MWVDGTYLRKLVETWNGPGLGGRLIRGTAGSLALKVVATGLALATAVLLARLLGPGGYGAYSHALALTSLLAVPAQLGLPTLVVRQVAAYQARGAWGLLRGVLLRTTQLALAISAVVATAGWLWARSAGDRMGGEELATLEWALALVPLAALASLRGAALRGLQRVVQGLLPDLVLRPGLLVLGVLTMAALGHALSPSRAMGLNVLATLVAFGVGAWLLGKALPAEVRGATAGYDTRAWLGSALSLSLLAAMQVITAQTDIVMLGWLTSPQEVGIYTVAVRGAALVVFVLQAVNLALEPHVARLYTTGDRERLQRTVTWSARVVLAAALPVAGLFALFGDAILRLVFGQPYVGAHTALTVLAAGQVVNAAMGSVGLLLNMTGRERETATGQAVAAAANVLLNLLLIPRYGVEGAAVATATSLVLWNLILAWKVYREIGVVPGAVGPMVLRRTA